MAAKGCGVSSWPAVVRAVVLTGEGSEHAEDVVEVHGCSDTAGHPRFVRGVLRTNLTWSSQSVLAVSQKGRSNSTRTSGIGTLRFTSGAYRSLVTTVRPLVFACAITQPSATYANSALAVPDRRTGHYSCRGPDAILGAPR